MEFPKELPLAFAASYRRALQDLGQSHPFLLPVKEHLQLQDNALDVALVLYEFERLEFSKDWKVTDVNSEFGICRSYPRYHIMPRDIKDNDIPSMATFRSHNRFPSVVWRSRKTGAVLLRCAQPCVGIMYSRNELDELFVKSVLSNCRNDHKLKNRCEDPPRLLIIDARNYSAAQLNRLRGGGFEYVEYYEQSQIKFMDLPNLHSVRLSFERLTQLYESKPETNWYSALEKTLWLYYISQLIKSASEVAAALDAHCRPVMVHCTDGWDRTPQLTSLAKILLDPFYRTIQGFRILVEHEWLQFGHKFGDRCGHNPSSGPEERSPIFLQWLDCVRQVHHQFPAYFEFNELFLIKLAMHTYSGLFGTFLFNSERDRHAAQCSQQTCSLWAFLNPTRNWSLRNYLYEPKQEVIKPAWQVRSLDLWDSLYQTALLPCTVFNPPAATTATSEHRELGKQSAIPNDFLPDSTVSLPVSQPLEVTPLATASSGPPTGGRPVVQLGSSINTLFEESASSNKLPRSKSLMALSTGSPKVRSNVASDDIEATLHTRFLVSTTLTPTEDKGKFDKVDSGDIRGGKKITLSSSLTSLPDTAKVGRAFDKRKQLSSSASNLSFRFGPEARHYNPDTETEILCASPVELLPVNNFPPAHPSSSRGNISSSVFVGGIRTYLSDQDLSSQKCTHSRSASDPPSAYRKIRLSSFVGDDLLLVDSLPVPVADHNQTFLQPVEVTDGPKWRTESPPSETTSIWPDSSSTSSDSLVSQRAVEPAKTLVVSASVGASDLTLVKSEKSTLRLTDDRPSAETTLADNMRYFVQPTFSASYLSLDNPIRAPSCSDHVSSPQETANFTSDSSGEREEVTLSSEFPHFFLSDGRLDSEFHPGFIPRSQTMTGSGAKRYLLPLKTSSSLRFGSPPENLDLFLNDGSALDSHDIKPLCSVWPSDLDGLPMRVDSVTLRLHEKNYQEEQLHLQQQSVINTLASEVETAKDAISSLRQELARLQRLFESQARHDGNFSDVSGGGPAFSSDETKACPNGDSNSVKPSFSLEEALSDAMDFSDSLNAMTDDDLIELTDDYRLRPMSARQMLRIATRDVVRSHSISSDVSSFEVVDAKDAGPGLPSSVESTTIVLPECGTCHLPFGATRPSHACGDCGRLFCDICLRFPAFHDGNSLHAGRLMGVCDGCRRHFNASGHENLQRPQSPRKYAAHPSVPLLVPDSIEPNRTVESFPRTKAEPPSSNNGTLGLLAEVQEEFPSHPSIHYRYINPASRPYQNQPVLRTYSTLDDSPVKEDLFAVFYFLAYAVAVCVDPITLMF
ncbi:Myotubularin-related protein 4 [Sparganum proliferum]